MASIFLSYSHADEQFARGLTSALNGLGHRTWIGEEQIAYGDSLIDATQEALRTSSAVVVLLTEASRNSQWVAFELGAATAQGKRIFPILLSEDPSVVPFQLQRIQYLRADPSDPADVARTIAKALEGEA